jgi:hypothetical protein
MIIDYKGICEFNISKGRWHSFNAIMSVKSSGLQNVTQKYKYSLIEAEVDDYDKELIKK